MSYNSEIITNKTELIKVYVANIINNPQKRMFFLQTKKPPKWRLF